MGRRAPLWYVQLDTDEDGCVVDPLPLLLSPSHFPTPPPPRSPRRPDPGHSHHNRLYPGSALGLPFVYMHSLWLILPGTESAAFIVISKRPVAVVLFFLLSFYSPPSEDTASCCVIILLMSGRCSLGAETNGRLGWLMLGCHGYRAVPRSLAPSSSRRHAVCVRAASWASGRNC